MEQIDVYRVLTPGQLPAFWQSFPATVWARESGPAMTTGFNVIIRTPIATGILDTDEIEIRGYRQCIIGDVADWVSGTGIFRGEQFACEQLYSSSVTRLRPVMVDDLGLERPDWSQSAAQLVMPGVQFEYLTSTSDDAQRISTTTTAKLTGPLDIDVVPTDHFTVVGEEWEVVGVPLRDPATMEATVNLRRVSG